MKHSDFDKVKLSVRTALYVIHKAYGSREQIEADVENTKNPVVRKLWSIVKECSENVLPKHHRTVLRDFGAFGLWIYAHDGAYQAQFDWVLRRVLSIGEEIRPWLRGEDPAAWRINRWFIQQFGEKQNDAHPASSR